MKKLFLPFMQKKNFLAFMQKTKSRATETNLIA